LRSGNRSLESPSKASLKTVGFFLLMVVRGPGVATTVVGQFCNSIAKPIAAVIEATVRYDLDPSQFQEISAASPSGWTSTCRPVSKCLQRFLITYRSALELTSSSFVDDVVQLLRQGLRDVVELNKAACLKFDVRSLQVVANRLAKLIGCPNSLPNQIRQHAIQFPCG
jgi:hypothetical protein